MRTTLNYSQEQAVTITIPPNFAQVSINFAGPTPSGKAVVLHGHSLGEEGTLSGLAGLWATAMEETMAPILNQKWLIESISVTTEDEYYEQSVNYGGESSPATPPPSVTTLVRKVTGLRGRANRGRNYWPGLLTENDVSDEGDINPIKVDDIQDRIVGIGEVLFTAGYTPVILHTSPALAPTPVTNIVVEAKVATQRRRLR